MFRLGAGAWILKETQAAKHNTTCLFAPFREFRNAPPVPPITVPATNPSFPAGTGLTSRLLRYTFLNPGPTTQTDAKTWNPSLHLQGAIGQSVERPVRH
jgi:hypothetical protein